MIRLAVRCPAEHSDVVLAGLIDLAPDGVEQVDHGAQTEFAIYGPPGEIPDLGGQRAYVNGIEVDVEAGEVGDDWADRWREFHKPVEIGDRIVVRPPWEPAQPGTEDIVIDPGRAFGTAAHPTTRMCAELLLDLASAGQARGELADLGTGSGVLSIIAARLGWNPVLAVDHEPAAIEAASANAAANAVEVDLRRLDLRREPPPLAPTVVANLTADLLVIVAERISFAPRAPARLICSGLTPQQANRVEAEFWGARLAATRRLDSGDWAAIAFARRD